MIAGCENSVGWRQSALHPQRKSWCHGQVFASCIQDTYTSAGYPWKLQTPLPILGHVHCLSHDILHNASDAISRCQSASESSLCASSVPLIYFVSYRLPFDSCSDLRLFLSSRRYSTWHPPPSAVQKCRCSSTLQKGDAVRTSSPAPGSHPTLKSYPFEHL